MNRQLMIAAVIISSLLSLVLFPGCGRNSEIKSIMQDMRASELAIQNDLQKIDSRSISRVSSVRKDATLIIYYDSLTCSMCNINKLHQLDTLFGLEKTFPGFEVMVIFSPATTEIEETLVSLMQINYDNPVYLDLSGSFRNSNKYIPGDNRFHTFLVGPKGSPVFIGSPYTSKNMWELFLTAIRMSTDTKQ